MGKKKEEKKIKDILNNVGLSQNMSNLIYKYIDYSHSNLLKIYQQTSLNQPPLLILSIFESVISAIKLGYCGIGFDPKNISKDLIDNFLKIYTNFEYGSYSGYSYICLKGTKCGTWLHFFLTRY
jgi:hypothetical protein